MTDNTRNIILAAAQKRLLHYGFHKTTMAEIADDAGMSAANLYRYFENKQDIVAQVAADCLDERLDRLREVVKGGETSAEEKLCQYVLALIDDSHMLAGPDSRIGELVDTMTRERPAIIKSKNELHFALLADIVRQGNATGEFCIEDVAACARNLHSALTLFEVPLFVGFYTRDEFDERARELVKLLVHGLCARDRG